LLMSKPFHTPRATRSSLSSQVMKYFNAFYLFLTCCTPISLCLFPTHLSLHRKCLPVTFLMSKRFHGPKPRARPSLPRYYSV
jgi:hypothetical protein